MPCFFLRRLLPTALAMLSTSVYAQAAPGPGQRPDPLDAKAPVPALTYRSPLARYPRSRDTQAQPWREANDTAARVGGWKAYAREAQAAEAAASSNEPSKPSQQGPGHAEHKTP